MITWFSRKIRDTDNSTKTSDDFVSLSSHELRSPLSIIKWYTEILLDEDAGPLTDDQRKYLTVIESSNQRAIDLVRSLLNVSRLDLGTFSIKPEPLSIDAGIETIIATLLPLSSAKDITIIHEKEGVLPTISIDKHLCDMVVRNILTNAILFSKKGGKVFVKTSLVAAHTIKEKMSIPEESVLIAVGDEGIGIPEKDTVNIFKKMFKASNVKDSETTGSGLGLYITKSILDHSGGLIWFTSTENVGSIFYVTFPTKGMTKKEGRTTLD
jgi:signal transduction histidine kinase